VCGAGKWGVNCVGDHTVLLHIILQYFYRYSVWDQVQILPHCLTILRQKLRGRGPRKINNPFPGYFHTDKNEDKIFLICKEIQEGFGAKTDMTNNLLIYGKIFAHFLIY
jgi:hypothetical protein